MGSKIQRKRRRGQRAKQHVAAIMLCVQARGMKTTYTYSPRSIFSRFSIPPDEWPAFCEIAKAVIGRVPARHAATFDMSYVCFYG